MLSISIRIAILVIFALPVFCAFAADGSENDPIDYEKAVSEWLDTLEREISDGTEKEKENAELLRDWIVQVDSALDDGNFELAHALLGLRTSGMFRHPLQAKVSFPLSRRLGKLVGSSLDEHVERIDRFEEKVVEQVKTAENGSDLEPFLMEGSRIERSMERLTKFGSHFRIDNRFSTKLNAAQSFARSFAEYLDKRMAGDMQGANSALRSALRTPIGAETFSREEAGRMEVRSRLGVDRLFDDVQSISDFDELSEIIGDWKTTAPPVSSIEDDGLAEIVETGRRVKRLRDNGHLNAALALAGDTLPSNDLRRFPALQRIFSATVEDLLNAKVEEIAGIERGDSETPVSYAIRATKQEIEDGRHQSAYRIGRALADSGYRDGVPSWFSSEISSLKSWIVGKRFSDAGDGPMAVKHLRRALEKSLGHLHSSDLVSKELERWKKAEPELFESWEESDDNSLRREVERLNSELMSQKMEIEALKRSAQR